MHRRARRILSTMDLLQASLFMATCPEEIRPIALIRVRVLEASGKHYRCDRCGPVAERPVLLTRRAENTTGEVHRPGDRLCLPCRNNLRFSGYPEPEEELWVIESRDMKNKATRWRNRPRKGAS